VSTTAPQTRHAVSALIVAHDGARLLPGLVQALQAQTYPVEQAVGVDTGSRDRSGAVLAELIGRDAVFGLDRSTGYGEAVAVARRHAAGRDSGRTDPNLTRVEWIWLLHDDCEPAPEALERLLRAASRDRSVAVLGPKVLDGQDRRTLREAGVSIDRAGRRVTGIDPGEIDQGQHDHNKAVLAVGSAGMLVRRDVWDQLGGFDTRLRLFRDDLDFCWRVQGAGYRVQVVTDAVLYHRELSARRRRAADGITARALDRRNALYVLAANLPLLPLLTIVGGAVLGSLVRAVYFALTKQLDLARAHAAAVAWLLCHPIRLWQARRRRAAGRAKAYDAVRSFIVPARTFSRVAERVAGLISDGPPQASGGRHQASEESDEDAQFVDTQSLARKFIGNPGVQLFAALLLVALIAERRLLGTSPLGGGALVPAWGGSAALWREYLAGFHTVGLGSTAPAAPYLAVVAALGTILGGQAWLAVDVLLLGCVPLAGLTAYLATRRLVAATGARVLLAASYALLPVATGAIAAGRLGTAVAFTLLPLVAVSAGRMITGTPKKARRAAWAVGLLAAVAAAFAPLTWILAVALAIAVLAARRWVVSADPVNPALVAVVPFFVLFPWSLHLLTDPAAFIAEAGVQTAGLTTAGLGPSAVLALSPGGPGVPPVWVTAGFGLALLAVVLPTRRTWVTAVGWCAAIVGFLAATAVSRLHVPTDSGGQSAAGWPGVALALAALGLLLAAAPAVGWLAEIVQNGRVVAPEPATRSRPQATGAGYGPFRRIVAGVALAAAASAPLLVAGYWLKGGVQGPVGSVSSPLLPAFVAASSTSSEQYRTLILRPDGAVLDYEVVRQGDPTLGEPELTPSAAATQALSRQVAALGAPDGADAGDPGLLLGSFGIRWVLLPGPVDPTLAQRLDGAVGLVLLSTSASYDLWQVAGPVGRVRVVAPDGTMTVLASGPLGASGVSAPAAGGTLLLAEPYGGWTATLNGRALRPITTPVDGWAQGFTLPAGGGRLSITRDNLPRAVSLLAELVALLAVCVLALPGKRADPAEEADALAAPREAKGAKRGARRGLRLAPPSPRSGAAVDEGDDAVADPEVADPAIADPAVVAAVAAAGVAGSRARIRRPEADADDFGPGALPQTVAVAEWPAGGTTDVPGVAGLAARDLPADGDDQEPADQGRRRPGNADDDRGGLAEERAPWDMAGDWGSGGRGQEPDPWGGDPWSEGLPPMAGRPGATGRAPVGPGPARQPGTGGQPVSVGQRGGASQRGPGGQRDGAGQWGRNDDQTEQWGQPGHRSLTGPPAAASQRPDQQRTGQPGTGQQRAMPRDAPSSPSSPSSLRGQWDSGPQAATPSRDRRDAGRDGDAWSADRWGSGPQRAVGPEPGRGTRPLLPAFGTGPQRSAPWSTGPQAPLPAPASGPAAEPWGAGQQVAASAWSRDTGEWGVPARPAQPDETAYPDETAEADERETGSGPWPAAAVPEAPAAAKPERHSHRASKHGKPSRWRGSGDRPGSGGES
jgi:GT2 family glycosyltransferase